MQDNTRKIGILGSTGSIGSSACELLLGDLKGKFTVQFLSCNENFEKISKQIINFNPQAICVSKKIFAKIKEAFPKLKVYDSIKTMLEEQKTDVTLHAISGVAGIECVLEAVGSTKVLALANKECIVSAWSFIEEKSIECGVQILPVDSEHNSLYRILEFVDSSLVANVGITASGGPFFGKKFKDLTNISFADAMNHPVWNMGVKNTIDSATMANKVLEVIEVMNLFNIKADMIDVFINRQSIIHASVGLRSGGALSFSSKPDMKSHIGHAIMFPEYEEAFVNPFNGLLEFAEIKQDEFPIFFIGQDVAKSGDVSKFTIFNVANQVAVEKFTKGEIKYTQIFDTIAKALEEKTLAKAANIDDLSIQINILKKELSQ